MLACSGRSPSDGPPRISLSIPDQNPSAASIEVRNLPSSALSALRSRTLTRDDWTALLRVSVASPVAADRPAVAGAYDIDGDAIRFRPRFPFDPGRKYEVRFDPSRLGGAGGMIVEVVSLPKIDVPPSTVVAATYPTTDVLPENLLRFYVTFSAPMGRKGGLDYIRLLDAKGREVKDPFLPVEVSGAEFWNDDRTRYTVFVDPGRIKRGVRPNEEMGRSFEPGGAYTIVVDREWRDAQGLPLNEEYRRQFRVGPPDERPLETRTWRIAAPAADTRDPLVLTFPDPLDHGLLLRALGVARQGATASAKAPAVKNVAGEATIDRHETRWRFTPHDAWTAGAIRSSC